MEFRRRPSALVYHLRALFPSPGVRGAGNVPEIRARWSAHRVNQRQLGEFLELSGLGAGDALPMLYPHVFGFPLQLSVLTHRRFPLPIWKMLQIRNHLLQHRPIPREASLNMETRLAGQRILEKGAEFDLHTRVYAGGELSWESLNTFYFRGRFGEPGPASPMATAPRPDRVMVARWRTVAASGRRLASQTGDYNGIHYWDWYARRLGFRRAFLHSQLVLGQCMARLGTPPDTARQRLDAWLRGPVYHGAEVGLLATSDADGTVFGLMTEGEDRPAILGRWSSGAAVGPGLGASSRSEAGGPRS